MVERSLLVVEDDVALREAIVDTLSLSGYHCYQAGSGEEALLLLKKEAIELVISDVQMPGLDGLQLLRSMHHQQIDLPVIMMTAYARVDDAVVAMREGAVDYLSKPFSTEKLQQLVCRYLPVSEESIDQPVAEDASSKNLFQLAERVAASDATVMITGPSGSGKEVLAHFIHQQSARSEQPFVAINCAAIPESMLESILFGYEKGAFTGAVQSSPGKFELAQGGTLLLDEITEMDLSLQAKLLRVLQERQVERLGGRKTIQLDVRVIATSNRDLKEAVKQGQFREDLMYRLNVFPLHWKALAERRDDIEPLAELLLRRHAQRAGISYPVSLADDAKQRLREYHWPGNVRELENVIQRALIMHQGETINANDILLDEQHGAAEMALPEQLEQQQADGLGGELFQQEYRIISAALQRNGGKRKDVAEELGISPRTLRYKIAKMREQGLVIPK
ncbi:sigma-54-dependent Fis family transcriptional regulator [Idiomarina tyrosinivorans]|uniref:Sigma-54-dependent Fis family transcriptional regulator n=1 Tax=Idiomarina tyrosinivorans TaxID=1445662 RepID=A0A432ZSJ9_9GAMM|nr:sigma-54 dependent transcriptional regulator [Idiomarina tyrosinivorans]RUO80877.1 sigma-54-dependent Fis family transcriptional regulator [Idiomarina tyrosinivorans]